MLKRLLDHLLALETISGDGLCPVYMYRRRLARLGKWGAVYLHHFVGNDWSADLHDHPKRFISIGLAGEYWEDSWTPEGRVTRHYRAPWVRTFSAEHRHRLRVKPRRWEAPTCRRAGAWTICIVGPVVREWGFWYLGRKWIPWRSYVWGPAGAARKDC